ncbi:MAG TPA: cytochrome c biogenesis protein CcsA, partial [Vicinamibacteria bacterium]|nr:cytochrome c biogenesis protein CcsA [Vicinamibacteria bacterium]
PVEREVLDLYDTLLAYQGVMSGESLHVVPHPDDPKAAWYSIADLASPPVAALPQVQRVRALTSALVVSYRDGDGAGVQTAASALGSRLAELAPGIYPAQKDLALEVHYNRAKPFRTAWLLYLLGFLALLASFPLASRRFAGAGFLLVVGGFLSQAYGMTLRVLISGRPPVTNMYESVVWVAFGAVLFALVFELVYKVRIFAACASALAVVCLILADNVPILDGSIAPLVPVLRDNMWLTVHVLTITLGYAAFTLAMGIGHLNLGLYFFRPAEVSLFKTLSLFLYRALQVGTLFLAVGTLLGGVWASYSWGRFWGWDPKETWALIATLGYLAILHGRFAGWIKDFGMAVGSLVGYLLVLMAWYGVNFVLGTGLHSYGFGSGGYRYVGGFVAFEALVITAALLRRRSELQKHATPAPAPAAAH